MHYFVVFLRGINVGGNNIIRMQDLRDCLTDAGYTDVNTYIQSGNIVLASKKKSANTLKKNLEQLLQKRFDYNNPMCVLSDQAFNDILASAPSWIGKNSTLYKYDIIFFTEKVNVDTIANDIRCREKVDTVAKGHQSLWYRRKVDMLTKSYLKK